MRKKSGYVNDKRLLVGFLYLLMRDRVTPGMIESIVLEISNAHDHKTAKIEKFEFTNGWLAKYCQDVADRLLKQPITKKKLTPDSGQSYNRFK